MDRILALRPVEETGPDFSKKSAHFATATTAKHCIGTKKPPLAPLTAPPFRAFLVLEKI